MTSKNLLSRREVMKICGMSLLASPLAGLCIGDQREYRKHQEILERVRKTLKFLANDLPNEHGFFYHFIHMDTGQRWEKCELSSIDTSILLCGVLTARQYFADQEIKDP